jgi:4-hydroxy-tetrahydrodipicolinate synthase
LKEASGNLVQAAKVIAGTGDDFMVYSGNDDDTLPLLAIGGDGVISVASHLVGKQMQEMITSFLRGNIETASRIHRDLLPLFNAMFLLAPNTGQICIESHRIQRRRASAAIKRPG